MLNRRINIRLISVYILSLGLCLAACSNTNGKVEQSTSTDETKGEVGAETSLENSAESAISSGTENPVNDNEEEKGAGNNKFISTPEMATISKDFFLDISDDEAIDAYILELSYSNTQTYFAYPAKYFE